MAAAPQINRFTITSPTTGFPVPGSQKFFGAPPHVVLYPYDPLFTPKRPIIDVGEYEGLQGGAGDAANWVDGLGGSARPGTQLKGKQYWEVFIKSLPVDVPHSWTDPNAPPFNLWKDVSHPLGPNAQGTSTWLPALNTFFNPVIGLWPKCSTFGKLDVIGLDDIDAKLRSIGVTRTNTVAADTVKPGLKATPGYAGVFPYSNFEIRDVVEGPFEDTTFEFNHGSDPAYVPPTPLKVFLSRKRSQLWRTDHVCIRDGVDVNGDPIGHLQTEPTVYDRDVALVYSVASASSAQAGKDDAAATNAFVAPFYTPQNTGIFAGLEFNGVLIGGGIAARLPDPQVDPVTTTNLYGYLFSAPDINLGVHGSQGDRAYLGDHGVVVPWGAGPGIHGPVFKGRGDWLTSIKTHGEDPVPGSFKGGTADPKVPGSYLGAGPDWIPQGPYTRPSVANDGLGVTGTPVPEGIWTGVDLGQWGEGDTIMIATDADSRKVWFGINGVWKGPGGIVPPNPETGLGWACYMDGPAAAGTPGGKDFIASAAKYFPGVSCRAAETVCEMRFGPLDTIFPVPIGFSSFHARYF